MLKAIHGAFIVAFAVAGISSKPALADEGDLHLAGNPMSDHSQNVVPDYDGLLSNFRGRTSFFDDRSLWLPLADGIGPGKTRVLTFRKGAQNVGAIEISVAGTNYLTISDRRLKANVTPLTQGWSRVAAYRPVEFDWKSNGEHDRGFIADEFAEVNPMAVVGKKNGPTSQMLDSNKAMADVISALQEAQVRIEALEKKVAELEARK